VEGGGDAPDGEPVGGERGGEREEARHDHRHEQHHHARLRVALVGGRTIMSDVE
jgi:hypothetical protein